MESNTQVNPVVRLLERGLELISAPGGWGKRALFPDLGRKLETCGAEAALRARCFCAVGATLRARVDLQLTQRTELAADHALYLALGELPAPARGNLHQVSAYNDRPATTLQDVQALYRRAIELASDLGLA